MQYLRERKAVIATCQRMNALGINQGTSGNVSQRIPEGYLLTASGVAYDKMQPEQVVEMDLDAGYRGDWLPSSEWRMHQDLFRARVDAGAVIHTHSTYATAMSCLRRDIPAFHYMIAVCGGATLRCADYATFGTQALSDAMLAAITDRTACLLANHGMICLAADLDGALKLAVEVETLCRQYYIASQAGEPVLLDDAEMRRVLQRFRSYGKQTQGADDNSAPAVDAPQRRDSG
ncbi:MAG: class II aldolase/adducin family protein [Gammaproteobacteria bacterium]|nr:class II aldolase/adducin family protein [Gammaproteobacteria bacterium]